MVKGYQSDRQGARRKEMKEFGMGAVLGVGKGSVHEPQFIVASIVAPVKKISRSFWSAKASRLTPAASTSSLATICTRCTWTCRAAPRSSTRSRWRQNLKLKANVVALVPAVENAATTTRCAPAIFSNHVGQNNRGIQHRRRRPRHTRRWHHLRQALQSCWWSMSRRSPARHSSRLARKRRLS